ncbi:hypothetical protein LPJ60_005989, partial [Coemansia sp. RSA 2675]
MLPRRSKYRTVETTASPLENMQRHPVAVASTSIRQHRDIPSVDSLSEQVLRTSSPPRESADELYDESGHLITPARLQDLFGPFVFMSVDMLPLAYEHRYGCSPIRPGASLEWFSSSLEKMEGLKSISVWNLGTKRTFIQCTGAELMERHKHMLTRLQLRGEQDAAVPAPLLCYLLSTLAYMHVSDMTGLALGAMFEAVAKHNPGSLRVATGSGIATKTLDELCALVKKWRRDIHMAVVIGRIENESLEIARKCNTLYLERCQEGGYNGGVMDTDGVVADEMLASNTCFSRSFLGIKASELKLLFKHSGCMVDEAPQ